MQISCIKEDITTLDVDAIVNAANSSLSGGAGVDGAIHKNGGPSIAEECSIIRAKQGGCPPGEAVITTAGKLKAKHIIHTVGPIWNKDKHAEKTLAQCYYNSLALAHKHSLSSIAFPNISTGVYGFPKELAVQTVKKVFDTIQDEIAKTGKSLFPTIQKVLFCCFDTENYRLYTNAFS